MLDVHIPEFQSHSYLEFKGLGRKALLFLEIELVLKATKADGLILYNGYTLDRMGDFISLALHGGYLEFRFDLGTGPAVIRYKFKFLFCLQQVLFLFIQLFVNYICIWFNKKRSTWNHFICFIFWLYVLALRFCIFLFKFLRVVKSFHFFPNFQVKGSNCTEPVALGKDISHWYGRYSRNRQWDCCHWSFSWRIYTADRHTEHVYRWSQ